MIDQTEKTTKKIKRGAMFSIVDMDTRGRSYADTLKDSKKNIIPESSGVVIQKEEGAAIKIVNTNIGIQAQGSGKGFTWIKTGKVVLYSCYAPPRTPLHEFAKFLSELEDNIKTLKDKRIVVTRDFKYCRDRMGEQIQQP